MADIVAIKYRAFLSYSHHDKAWAKWLHASLESYRIDKDLMGRDTALGPVPSTLRPIFCDRDDFSAGHSLSEQTLAALAASRCLVVICSPHAVVSQYVNEEIRQFKALGGAQRIIPIIVDGEPGNAERECFPPALRFKVTPDGTLTNVPEEPIAADARAQGDGKKLAMLKVVTGLLGVGLDEVVRRAEIARRKRKRLGLSLAGAALVLTAIAAGVSFFDYRYRSENEAKQERNLQAAIDENTRIEARKRRGEAVETLLSSLSSLDRLINDNGLDTMPKGRYVKAQTDIIFASAYQSLGKSDESFKHAQDASELLEKLITEGAQELGWRNHLTTWYEKLTGVVRPDQLELQNKLAVAYQKIGDSLFYRDQLAVARDWYRKSLDRAELVQKADPSNIEWQRVLSVAYDKLGDASKGLGNFDEARRYYQRSLESRDQLATANPDNPQLQRDLASVYDRLADVLCVEGKIDKAMKAEEHALQIVESLLKDDAKNDDARRNRALLYRKIADINRSVGRRDMALAGYRKSFEIVNELRIRDEDNTEWRRDLAASHLGIGAVLAEQGQTDPDENFGRGIEILKQLEKSDPTSTDWKATLARAYDQFGSALVRQATRAPDKFDPAMADKSPAGILSQALEYYEESLAIRDELTVKDPKNLKWQYELAVSHGNRANVLIPQGNFDLARKELEVAQKTFQQLSQDEPLVLLFQHDVATAILRIGDAFNGEQRFTEALVQFREGLSILQDAAGDNITWQYELVIAHGRIANASRSLGKAAEALSELRKARDIETQLVQKLPQLAADLSGLDAEIAALEAEAPIKVAD